MSSYRLKIEDRIIMFGSFRLTAGAIPGAIGKSHGHALQTFSTEALRIFSAENHTGDEMFSCSR